MNPILNLFPEFFYVRRVELFFEREIQNYVFFQFGVEFFKFFGFQLLFAYCNRRAYIKRNKLFQKRVENERVNLF